MTRFFRTVGFLSLLVLAMALYNDQAFADQQHPMNLSLDDMHSNLSANSSAALGHVQAMFRSLQNRMDGLLDLDVSRR